MNQQRRQRSYLLRAGGYLLAATMVACGGAPAATTATPAATAGSQVTASPTASADAGKAAWDAVVAAAKTEGQLAVYTTESQSTIDNVLKDFNVLYPEIKVSVVRAPSGQLGIRIEQEEASGAPSADILTTQDWLQAKRFARAGKMVKPVGPQVSSSNWKDSQLLREGTYIWASYNPYGFAHNTKLLPNPPKTFQELAKRTDLAGKIGALTPNIALTIAAWYKHVENRAGNDFLRQFSALKPSFYSSTAPELQAVAAGELWFGSFATPAFALSLADSGAPIKFIYVKDGAGAPTSIGIMAKGANKNAAQVFMNFVMSEKGQRLLTFDGKTAIPAVPGIDGPLGKSGDASLFELIEEAEAMDNAAFEAYVTYWNGVMRK